MNRIVLIFSALALFAACEKYVDEVVTDGGLHAVTLPDVICASMSGDDMDPKTRTWLGGEEGKDVLWHGDDEISYFSGTIHANYVSQGEGDSSVEFIEGEKEHVSLDSAVDGTISVYPYNSDNSLRIFSGEPVIYTSFPSIQTYAPDSFGKGANVMVAKSETAGADNLNFRNACGFLVIKLYGTDTAVKSIVLSSKSGLDRISGSAYVTVDNTKDPEVTMTGYSKTTITLDCNNGGEGVLLGEDKEHATEFWFALPPVTFEKGFTIVVTDTRDISYIESTSKSVTITRNNIQPMAPLEFEHNYLASTDSYKLWYRAEKKLDFEYEGAQIPWFNTEIKSHEWVEETNLYCIEFNEPLARIGEDAFRGDDRGAKVSYVVLPEGLATICEGAFRDSDLTFLRIPGTVNNIHPDAFYNCQSLKDITFDPSPYNMPLNIGYSTTPGGEQIGPFYYSPLQNIRVNREMRYRKGEYNSEEFIPDEEDEGIFAIEEVDEERSGTYLEIGAQVKTLHDFMFCNNPISVLDIPGTLNSIGNNVFNGCEDLERITFEPSPTTTPLTLGYNTDGEEDGPFLDSPLLTVNLDREINYTLASGDLDATDEGVFSGREELTTVTLGDQVRTLSDYMFANTGFSTIDLNNVRKIGKGVFWGAGLEVVTIPATLETIDVNAFINCDNLEYLYVLDDANALTVAIQDYNSSDWGPFYDSPLKSVYLGREIKYDDAAGNKFTADETSDGFFASEESIDDLEITLGNNVKTISDYMFAGLNIKSLTIPASVNYIGWEAFLDCEDLSSVTFEDGTETITVYSQFIDIRSYGPFYDSPLTEVYLGREIDYKKAGTNFDNCDWGFFASEKSVDQLSVTLSSNVKTILRYMFAKRPITEITIPASVTSIQNNAFEGCSELSRITFESSTEPLTMGYQAALDNVGPFYHSPLSYIKLDRELVPSANYQNKLDDWDMGVFSNKHYNDDDLTTSVHLGSNVQTILPWMFSGVRVHNIWIPETVTSIANSAFYDCRKLNDVTMGHHTPPAIGTGVFDSCDIFRYIVVRKSALDKYKAATDWDAYESRFYTKDDFE